MFVQLPKYLKLILLIAFFMPFQLLAQNQSTQTFFGKNRVQFKNFDWSFYRTSKYDVYFYAEGRDLAVYTARKAKEITLEVEEFMNYRIDGRYQIVVYRKLSDLQQTNLGLDLEQYNTGGLTKLVGNKILIHFTGDRNLFEKELRSGVAKVLMYDILYGGSIQESVQNSTLIYLPDWFLNGFLAYVESEWDTKTDNQLRDLYLMNRYKKFSHFINLDPTLAGKSFWYFLAEKYGKNTISNLIYLTRVNRDFEQALVYVLGNPLKKLAKEWQTFYDERYEDADEGRTILEKNFILKKFKKGTVINQVKLSPDGKKLAYVTHRKGLNKIWIYDFETEKHIQIHKSGLKYQTLKTKNQYPVLAWHPSGRNISYFYDEKAQINFGTIRLDFEKKPEPREFLMLRFDDVLAMDYSPDGQNIVLSASRKGQSDIFLYHVPSKRVIPITKDKFDDFSPRFFDKGNKILFSSNRITDTIGVPNIDSLKEQDFTDIFAYDLITKGFLQITKTPITNEVLPNEVNEKYFSFLSDDNGIQNRFYSYLDTIFSHYDTIMKLVSEDKIITFHSEVDTVYEIQKVYKDTAYYKIASNYARNIDWQEFSKRSPKMLQQMTYKRKPALYLLDVPKNQIWEREIIAPKTNYKLKIEEDYIEKLELEWLLSPAKNQGNNNSDTSGQNNNSSKININNYLFQVETDIPQVEDVPEGEGIDKINFTKDNKDPFRVTKTKIYQTAFSVDYLVSQFGNSLIQNNIPTFIISSLNSLSQRPGLIVMAGASDLFEDHKFTGGMRLSTDLRNNEYFLMYENLKNRWDKKFVFHQQRFKFNVDNNDQRKFTIHELMTSFKYPFNAHTSLHLNGLYRRDREEILSTEFPSLNAEGFTRNWLGGRTEFVFDNTKTKQLNILYGTRYKFFLEAYYQFEQDGQYMGIFGADIRNYTKIHKNFIWANRFVFNSSFGPQNVLYYLGGVDGWLFPRFDQSLSLIHI